MPAAADGGRAVRALFSCVALAAAAGSPAPAATWRVHPEHTILAVVTHRGGIAARMAHDHVVAASDYEARLALDPGDPAGALFELSLPVEALVVDDPAVQRRIASRLEELGVREGEFPEVAAGDRAKIREAMLARGQLHAAEHPRITATARVAGRLEDRDAGGLPFRVGLSIEIRGRRVEAEARARYDERDGRVEVEALAELRFTDFGIRPYSAFLGTVRNRDAFHVYVHLVAERESGGEP